MNADKRNVYAQANAVAGIEAGHYGGHVVVAGMETGWRVPRTS
jgi:hypothetical protein